MKNIYLLRHANALAPQGQMSDRERPVSQKGWKELDLLKPHVAMIFPLLDMIWCSNAKRTRQTLDHFQSLIVKKTQVLHVDGLYEIPVGGLLEKLKSLNDAIDSILIVGHNPSLSQLALTTIKNTSQAPATMIDMATGSLVFLQGDVGSWRNLSFESLIYKKHIDPAYL